MSQGAHKDTPVNGAGDLIKSEYCTLHRVLLIILINH